MKFFCEHMGWMDAVPSMRDSKGKRHFWDQTRGQSFKKNGVALEAPPEPRMLGLLRILSEIGPLRFNNEGVPRAIDWPEIDAFNRVSGPYSSWELATVREMAVAYLRGIKYGENPASRNPVERRRMLNV